METLMVMVIVGLAAGYLVKKYTGSIRKSSPEASCGCGCTSCPSASASECNDKNHIY